MRQDKPSKREFKKPYGLADKLLKRLEEYPSTVLLREALEKFIPKRDASSWWWWQAHPDLLVRRITKLIKELNSGWDKGKTPGSKTSYAIQRWLNLAPYEKPAPNMTDDRNTKAELLKPRLFVKAWIRNFMADLQDREGLKYNKGPTHLAVSIFKFQNGIVDENLETVLRFFYRAKRKYRNGRTGDSHLQPEAK